MSSNEISLEIYIINDSTNRTNLIKTTMSLKQQLSKQSYVNIQEDDQEPPEGSRLAGEIITAGQILLATLPNSIPLLMKWLREWVVRDPNNVIKFQLKQDENVVSVIINEDVTPEKLEEYIKVMSKGLKDLE